MEGRARKRKKVLVPVRGRGRERVVLVCRRCGLDSKALKRAIKSKASDHLAGLEVRVCLTSCLGICPKAGVAVGVAGQAIKTEFFVAKNAKAGAKELLDRMGQEGAQIDK